MTRTAADQALIEHLERILNETTRQTEAINELRGLTINNVLLDELVQIPASGFIMRNWSAPAAYIAVWAYGSQVTITSDPPAGPTAPSVGSGVKVVPAGAAMGWAFASSVVTIYGTPNDLVLVTAHSHVMQPFVGAAGAVIGGSP